MKKPLSAERPRDPQIHCEDHKHDPDLIRRKLEQTTERFLALLRAEAARDQ